MVQQYRNLLEQKKGRLKNLEAEKKKTETQFTEVNNTLVHTDEALAFIQKVANETQNQLKVHIEDIITMALESVLDEPYKLELDFIIKRNKTECDIWFTRNGKRISPIDASGGGAVDIASFASRIALWSLQSLNNVLVFDEPFKFVSYEYQSRVSDIISTISEKLGLQIIMVTHNKQFIEQADNIIHVSQNNGNSKIYKE